MLSAHYGSDIWYQSVISSDIFVLLLTFSSKDVRINVHYSLNFDCTEVLYFIQHPIPWPVSLPIFLSNKIGEFTNWIDNLEATVKCHDELENQFMQLIADCTKCFNRLTLPRLQIDKFETNRSGSSSWTWPTNDALMIQTRYSTCNNCWYSWPPKRDDFTTVNCTESSTARRWTAWVMNSMFRHVEPLYKKCRDILLEWLDDRKSVQRRDFPFQWSSFPTI